LTDVNPPCSRYGTTVGGAGPPVWPRRDRDRCGSKRAADKALSAMGYRGITLAERLDLLCSRPVSRDPLRGRVPVPVPAAQGG